MNRYGNTGEELSLVFEFDDDSDCTVKVSMLLEGEDNPVSLLDWVPSLGVVTIYPKDTRPNRHEDDKYTNIKKITIDGFHEEFDFFENEPNVDDILGILESLPTGFVKDYKFGLGLRKEYLSVITSIEEMDGVDEIYFREPISAFTDKPVIIDGNILYVSLGFFDSMRKEINKIIADNRHRSMVERRAYSYNEIFQHLDDYQERCVEYKESSVVSATKNMASRGISKNELKALVEVIDSPGFSKALADPKLSNNIPVLTSKLETVGLELFLKNFSSLLDGKANESSWQKLFKENVFLFSLIFSQPVVVFGEQYTVGGAGFDGTGAKVTDFLVNNSITGSLAILEIKRPSTPLLRAKQYREGVYGPSNELSSSIVQIQDQRYQLQNNFPSLKQNSNKYNIEAFNVECVLIVGKLSELNSDKDKIKSFDLYRGGLNNVKVITFDELHAKIEQLLIALDGRDSGLIS